MLINIFYQHLMQIALIRTFNNVFKSEFNANCSYYSLL